MKHSDLRYGMKHAHPALVQTFKEAIDAGFRHLDTAECYLTRIDVGTAVEQSGIDRSEFWITDKWDQGWLMDGKVFKSRSPSGPYESIKKCLELMHLSHLNLFLIHGPYFTKETCNVTVEEAWKQMEQIYEEGLADNIGVSNFDVPLLKRVFKVCKYKPQVDQIEYHLYLQQKEIVDFCKKNDILVEAFSPLTPMFSDRVGKNRPLNDIIARLCKKYNVEPNLLLLRWVYQSGVLPLTTSSNPQRMKYTFKIFDFELEPEDFNELQRIGQTFHYRGFFENYFERKE